MPAPTYPVKSASTLPFGSEVWTIDSVNYIAETIRVTQGSVLAERQDELGGPNGFALNKAAKTGTATLQLATATTAIPVVGHTFTRAADSTDYVLTEVGEERSQNGIPTLPVSFREDV
jgi:hypothetical protein